MILIEIKIEARYLKRNSQTLQGKDHENSIHMALWQLPRAFQLNGTLKYSRVSLPTETTALPG